MIPGYKLTKNASPKAYNLAGYDYDNQNAIRNRLDNTRVQDGDIIGYDFYHKQYPETGNSIQLYANIPNDPEFIKPDDRNNYIGDTYYDGLKSYNARLGITENDPRMRQPQPRKWYQKIFSPVADPVPASPQQQAQWNRAYRRHNWERIPDAFFAGPVHQDTVNHYTGIYNKIINQPISSITPRMVVDMQARPGYWDKQYQAGLNYVKNEQLPGVTKEYQENMFTNMDAIPDKDKTAQIYFDKYSPDSPTKGSGIFYPEGLKASADRPVTFDFDSTPSYSIGTRHDRFGTVNIPHGLTRWKMTGKDEYTKMLGDKLYNTSYGRSYQSATGKPVSERTSSYGSIKPMYPVGTAIDGSDAAKMNAMGVLQHEIRHNLQHPNLIEDYLPMKFGDSYTRDVIESSQASGSFNAAVHRITGDIIDSPYKKAQYIRKAMSDPEFMSKLTPEERRHLVAQFGVYQDGFFDNNNNNNNNDDSSIRRIGRRIRSYSNGLLNRDMRYAPIYQ